MRVLIVSKSWPSNERSGVSWAAFNHANLLINLGHQVSIMGSSPNISNELLKAENKIFIKSSGSGALYSPAKIDISALEEKIRWVNADLILIESWQTALGDATIAVGDKIGAPVVLVSHGISLHPFSYAPVDIVRAIGWLPYRFFVFPSLIKKVTLLTHLSKFSKSKRFYDHDLASKNNVNLILLRNFALKPNINYVDYENRKKIILMVGYFGAIKNQKELIRISDELPNDIHYYLVGEKKGRYYHQCLQLSKKQISSNRIHFFNDEEINIRALMSECLLVYMPSKTEALPITLLEAMSSGTPFVATSVGAIEELPGGLVGKRHKDRLTAIKKIIDNKFLWRSLSNSGRQEFQTNYTDKSTQKVFLEIMKRFSNEI